MNAQEVPQGRLHTPFYNRMKEIDKLNNWTTWAGYSSPHALYCPEVDFFAIRNGCVSISPLQVDLPRHSHIHELGEWVRNLEA